VVQIRAKSLPNSAIVRLCGDFSTHKKAATMSSSSDDNRPSARVNLTSQERKAAFVTLLSMVKNNNLPNGSYGVVAKKFRSTRKSISRMWIHLKKELLITMGAENQPVAFEDVSTTELIHQASSLPEGFYRSGRHRSGRRPLYEPEEIEDAVVALSPTKKTNQRSIAAALGVSKRFIQDLTRDGHLRKETSRLKPTVQQHHKDERLMWCFNMIDPTTMNPTRSSMKFQDMYDLVHVDEKWFNLKQVKAGFILSSKEKAPYRHTRHKNHIQKVQFLSALGRPHYVEETGEWFDGKIGMWPVGHWETYTRGGSVNARGAPKWVDDSIDGPKYYELLMDYVVPAILEKHPNIKLGKSVRIQQDGAPSHGVLARRPDVFTSAMEDMGIGDQIKLVTQPAQSPDLNVNDLGYFAAIQAAYYKKSPRNAVEMLAMVDECVSEFDVHKINRIWLTLQGCMNETINLHGANDYKIPHMQKEALEKQGTLPETLVVTESARPLLERLGCL
jgi:hypothetical protein